jgi:hypothetical protein
MEGMNRGLIAYTIPEYVWRKRERLREISDKRNYQPRSEPETFQIRRSLTTQQ